MTQKFNVGDKVRVIAEHFRLAKGETFVIASIDEDGDLFDNNGTCVIPSKVEKVNEGADVIMTEKTKFKVGDKVRVIRAEGSSHNNGDIGVIKSITGPFYDVVVDGCLQGHYADDIELINAKPTQDKPTKKQRLSELERQVAELQAEVASLKEAQKPTYTMAVDFAKPATLSANEQRKAIIAEAKAFVEGAKNFTGSLTGRKGYRYASTGRIVCDVEFIVDAKKRTVVALLKEQMGAKNVRAKGIAKCAPDDVFNADIGKAIALGRALGLDVERFEQAVKPTEYVAEQVISYHTLDGEKIVTELAKVVGRELWTRKTGGYITSDRASKFAEADTPKILDDTEAKY